MSLNYVLVMLVSLCHLLIQPVPVVAEQKSTKYIEVIQFRWDIRNFKSLRANPNDVIISPTFPRTEHPETTWQINLNPKGNYSPGNVSMFLCNKENSADMEFATFELGIARKRFGRKEKMFTKYVDDLVTFHDPETNIVCFGYEKFLPISQVEDFLTDEGTLIVYAQVHRYRQAEELVNPLDLFSANRCFTTDDVYSVTSHQCVTGRSFEDINYRWITQLPEEDSFTLFSPIFPSSEKYRWNLKFEKVSPDSDTMAVYLEECKPNSHPVTAHYEIVFKSQSNRREDIVRSARYDRFATSDCTRGWPNMFNYSEFKKYYVNVNNFFEIDIRVSVINDQSICVSTCPLPDDRLNLSRNDTCCSDDFEMLMKLKNSAEIDINCNLFGDKYTELETLLLEESKKIASFQEQILADANRINILESKLTSEVETVVSLQNSLKLTNELNVELQTLNKQLENQIILLQNQIKVEADRVNLLDNKLLKEIENDLSIQKSLNSVTEMNMQLRFSNNQLENQTLFLQKQIQSENDRGRILENKLTTEMESNVSLQKSLKSATDLNTDLQTLNNRLAYQLSEELGKVVILEETLNNQSLFSKGNVSQECSTRGVSLDLPNDWKDRIPADGDSLWIIWLNATESKKGVLIAKDDVIISRNKTISVTNANYIPVTSSSSIELAYKSYIMAEAFNLTSLKSGMEEYLIRSLDTNNILEILKVMFETGYNDLTIAALNFLFANYNEIPSSDIQRVLNNSKELRDFAQFHFRLYCDRTLMKNTELCNNLTPFGALKLRDVLSSNCDFWSMLF